MSGGTAPNALCVSQGVSEALVLKATVLSQSSPVWVHSFPRYLVAIGGNPMLASAVQWRGRGSPECLALRVFKSSCGEQSMNLAARLRFRTRAACGTLHPDLSKRHFPTSGCSEGTTHLSGSLVLSNRNSPTLQPSSTFLNGEACHDGVGWDRCLKSCLNEDLNQRKGVDPLLPDSQPRK